MAYAALRSCRFPRQERRRRRNRAVLAAALAALGLAGARQAGWLGAPETSAARPASVAALPAPPPVRAASADYAWMLDPAPALGRENVDSAPLASAFQRTRPTPAGAEPSLIVAADPIRPMPQVAALDMPAAAIEMPAAAPPALQKPSVALPIPLPVPRPAEFRREPVAVAARIARPEPRPSTQSVFRAARIEEPSLLERIFGDGPAPAALGYAALETGPERTAPSGRAFPAPVPEATGGTAVYDITAQRVTLPNGEVLEAHSGLGSSMDNPRDVHRTMRGSTPPGTYDLREREALFHGVRAIRLNPVGGPAAIKGRVGLLAHTYMLGPSGASNGCVSFRDYNRFLQAYLRGEVRRLVVVAGNGQDGPSLGRRLFGMSGSGSGRS